MGDSGGSAATAAPGPHLASLPPPPSACATRANPRSVVGDGGPFCVPSLISHQPCPYVDLTSPRSACAATGSAYLPQPRDSSPWDVGCLGLGPRCCCRRRYVSPLQPRSVACVHPPGSASVPGLARSGAQRESWSAVVPMHSDANPPSIVNPPIDATVHRADVIGQGSLW